MNSRERVLAAAVCKPVDQKPILVWPHDEMYSDIAVVSAHRLANAAASKRIVLAEVLGPLALSLKKGLRLTRVLQENPAEGEKELESLVDETRAEIDSALSGGADGIFYRLQGAEPDFATPMEYGGHFLELDRALLSHARSASLNVLFVEGGPDLYIDFVSDLPADVFAWDKARSDIELETVRALRNGALATGDPGADILFGGAYGLLKPWASATSADLEEVTTRA